MNRPYIACKILGLVCLCLNSNTTNSIFQQKGVKATQCGKQAYSEYHQLDVHGYTLKHIQRTISVHTEQADSYGAICRILQHFSTGLTLKLLAAFSVDSSTYQEPRREHAYPTIALIWSAQLDIAPKCTYLGDSTCSTTCVKDPNPIPKIFVASEVSSRVFWQITRYRSSP